jgi:hypothetical protein
MKPLNNPKKDPVMLGCARKNRLSGKLAKNELVSLPLLSIYYWIEPYNSIMN